VRITPLGIIRFTWSANCEALIFETLGLRTLGLLIFVDFGSGVEVVAGFGNQGIQGFLEIAVAVGRGDGLLVVAVPGLPFFYLNDNVVIIISAYINASVAIAFFSVYGSSNGNSCY